MFSAQPAQAGGVYIYSMTDFQEICRYNCVGNGYTQLKQLWQNILWVTYHPNGWSTANCQSWVQGGGFGPNTETWTRKWQREHRANGEALKDDGRVGPKTWTSAIDAAQKWWDYSYTFNYDKKGTDLIYKRDYFSWAGTFTLMHEHYEEHKGGFSFTLKSRWKFNLCYGSSITIYQEDNNSPWGMP